MIKDTKVNGGQMPLKQIKKGIKVGELTKPG